MTPLYIKVKDLALRPFSIQKRKVKKMTLLSFTFFILIFISTACEKKATKEQTKDDDKSPIIIDDVYEREEDETEKTEKLKIYYNMRPLVENCEGGIKSVIDLVKNDYPESDFAKNVSENCSVQAVSKIRTLTIPESENYQTIKILWFEPGGEYIIEDPIYLEDNMIISGGGGYFRFGIDFNKEPEELTKHFGTIIFCNTGNSSACLNINNAQNSVIKRVVLKGTQEASTSYGIAIFNSKNITLKEIFFVNFKRTSVFASSIENCTFEDLVFKSTFELPLKPHGMILNGGISNTVSYSVFNGSSTVDQSGRRKGLGLAVGILINSGDWTIQGSNFELPSIQSIVVSGGNAVIKNNRFENHNMKPAGYETLGEIEIIDNASAKIVDNYWNLGCESTRDKYPILIRESSTGTVHIEGNTFTSFNNDCPIKNEIQSSENKTCLYNIARARRGYYDQRDHRWENRQFGFKIDANCTCSQVTPEIFSDTIMSCSCDKECICKRNCSGERECSEDYCNLTEENCINRCLNE